MNVDEEFCILSATSDYGFLDQFADDGFLSDHMDIGAMPTYWMADVFGSDISAVQSEDHFLATPPVNAKPAPCSMKVDVVSDRDILVQPVDKFKICSMDTTDVYKSTSNTKSVNNLPVVVQRGTDFVAVTAVKSEAAVALLNKQKIVRNSSLLHAQAILPKPNVEHLVDSGNCDTSIDAKDSAKQQTAAIVTLKTEEVTKNRQIFYCPYCALSDSELTVVRQHINSMHKKLEANLELTSQRKPKTKLVGSMFHCPYCRKKTNDFVLIQEHIGKRHKKQLQASRARGGKTGAIDHGFWSASPTDPQLCCSRKWRKQTTSRAVSKSKAKTPATASNHVIESQIPHPALGGETRLLQKGIAHHRNYAASDATDCAYSVLIGKTGPVSFKNNSRPVSRRRLSRCSSANSQNSSVDSEDDKKSRNRK